MSRGMYPRRIKLNPIDPDILKKYLSLLPAGDLYHHPERFSPIIGSSIFGRQVPLQLEVGCGTGEFLCSLADRDPKTGYIGIDVAYKPLHRSVEQADQLGLENIHFIKADIRLLYPLLVTDSISVVYLHFPVPSKKKSARKFKVFGRRFLEECHRILVPGGRVSVMTDRKSYYNEMVGLASVDSRFEFVQDGDYSFSMAEDLKSHNHRIWEGRGFSVQRFELETREV